MKFDENSYHKTVLKKKSIEYLNIKPYGLYIDATFGGGGHTAEILESDPSVKVVALDWDKDAIKKNEPLLKARYGDRIKVIWANFAHIKRVLDKEKILKVDGIIADFGTSQHQIKNKAGFSFDNDLPLDMRMSEAHFYFNASDVVNRYKVEDLANIIFKYGDERYSRRIARAIVEYRKNKKIETTKELSELIYKIYPRFKNKRRYKIHPATKTFQALRIFVNKELDNIEELLKASVDILKPGARIACISFHSLEDRIVKHFFKNNNEFKVITKKPIIPSDEEINLNRSSRSSKLRVAEKI